MTAEESAAACSLAESVANCELRVYHCVDTDTANLRDPAPRSGYFFWYSGRHRLVNGRAPVSLCDEQMAVRSLVVLYHCGVRLARGWAEALGTQRHRMTRCLVGSAVLGLIVGVSLGLAFWYFYLRSKRSLSTE